METNVTKDGNALICAVSGEIDLYEAPSLLERYRALAAREPDGAIIVDLSRSSYIDSSGIGALFQMYSDANLRGAPFCVCGAGGMVGKLLRLSKMTSILPNEPTLAHALRRVGGAR